MSLRARFAVCFCLPAGPEPELRKAASWYMDAVDDGSVHNFRKFHHSSQIHHTDTVGNMTYNGKIMCDEQIGQSHLILHVFEHVDYL